MRTFAMLGMLLVVQVSQQASAQEYVFEGSSTRPAYRIAPSGSPTTYEQPAAAGNSTPVIVSQPIPTNVVPQSTTAYRPAGNY
ncbi:MAG: hypothetical protein N2C14_08810, partial [Planctomycetales bacterium]